MQARFIITLLIAEICDMCTNIVKKNTFSYEVNCFDYGWRIFGKIILCVGIRGLA